jgi:hypothetical protein
MLGALLHKTNPAAPRQGPEKAAFPAHLAHWDGTYATAYVEDSSADEDDEGYWRGAWSEEPSGAAAAAGGSDGAGAVAPEEQRPVPEVWPCPPTSTARPCLARVAVLGMGGYKGRGVLARRALACGEEVGQEPAFAFVVRDQHAATSCAHCAAAVVTAACVEPDTGAADHHGSAAAFTFCGEECKATAWAAAAPYFEHVAELRQIATNCSVDVDLLRILLRLCCVPELREAAAAAAVTATEGSEAAEGGKVASPQQQFSTTSSAGGSDSCIGVGGGGSCSGGDDNMGSSGGSSAMVLRAQAVLALCTHEYSLQGSWLKAVGAATEQLLALLPPALHLPAAELVMLGARVNSNAYGVSDPSGTGQQGNVGFGLFPFAAMLNHSCDPNCAFSGVALGRGGAALTIRAIQPVAEGEELTFGYTDLYQDVVARREELESTKHFICECTRCMRCVQDPNSGAAIMDRRLSGVLCPSCVDRGETDGVLQPPGLLHDTDENNRLLANLVRGACVEHEVSCARCDTCSEVTSAAWLQQAIARASEAFADVQKVQSRAADREQLDAAHSGLTMFLELFRDRILHRQHALVFQAHCLLANCCLALERFSEAAVQLRAALRCVVACLNRNRAETASLFYQLGEALASSLAQRPPHSHDKIRQECYNAFRHSGTVCKVIYGPTHPLTAKTLERAHRIMNTSESKAKQRRLERAQSLSNKNDVATIATKHVELVPCACDYVCWDSQYSGV